MRQQTLWPPHAALLSFWRNIAPVWVYSAANLRSHPQPCTCYSSPHQRATSEYTNGLIRQFFPRRTILPEISDEFVEHVQTLINNRPRKCLRWRSPALLHLHWQSASQETICTIVLHIWRVIHDSLDPFGRLVVSNIKSYNLSWIPANHSVSRFFNPIVHVRLVHAHNLTYASTTYAWIIQLNGTRSGFLVIGLTLGGCVCFLAKSA